MSDTPVYNITGEKVASIKLNDKIFATKKVSPEVIQQIVYSMHSSSRNTVASTKTRGEVRGGGKKPWKQKGTGRARAGSIRSPLWRSGGITFGPAASRNFTKQINKKTKRLGLFMALTDKKVAEKVYVIDKFELTDPKTKALSEKLTQFFGKISADGKRTLFIIAEKNDDLIRASRNLSSVNLRAADNFNILDVLAADQILVLQGALPIMDKVYLGEK